MIGNVPFGQYKVADSRYDRHNFLIHSNDEMEIFACSYEDEAVMTRFWNQMHAA